MKGRRSGKRRRRGVKRSGRGIKGPRLKETWSAKEIATVLIAQQRKGGLFSSRSPSDSLLPSLPPSLPPRWWHGRSRRACDGGATEGLGPIRHCAFENCIAKPASTLSNSEQGCIQVGREGGREEGREGGREGAAEGSSAIRHCQVN